MPKKSPKIVNEEEESLTVIGYTPHAGQIKLNDLVLNQNYKYYTFCIGRQWGKSIWAQNIMLYYAINQPNSNIYYVSPTYKLARMIFSDMNDAIGESGILKSINKTQLIFTFENGSKISFHSGERPDTLRGGTISHLILDEFAYSKKALWEEVLMPACLIKGQKICFISTPAGRNHFYDLYMLGKSNDKENRKYCSYTAPSTDNPYMPKDELKMAQTNEMMFRQEYLAEFLEDSLSVFKNIKECIYPENMATFEPIRNHSYVIGIDLARKDDYTCGIIMDENKRVVDMLHIRYTSWSFIIEALANLYHKWTPSNGYIEVNFNENIYDELLKKGCKNIKPFITNPNNKPAIIQDLILDFERKEISIPNSEMMIDELGAYTFKFSKSTGKITYGAPNAVHDDIVMGMAFARAAWKNKKRAGKFEWGII